MTQGPSNTRKARLVDDAGDTTGTASNPLRINPTGTTAQPATNAAASQVDGHSASIGATTDADTALTLIGRVKKLVSLLAGGLPAALVGGRLDSNIGSWLGSMAPTVGAKTVVNSIPVTMATDQPPIPVTSAASNAVTGDVFGRVLYGGSSGVLTAVRATAYTEQLANFTGSIRSANVNDAAAGTGMRTVRITYYNQAGAGPFTEDVTLNGTTAVNLVNTDHCFIEDMEGLTDGSLNTNAGIITLFTGAAGGGTAVGTIGVGNVVSAVGDGQTFWAHHYVAAGKTASLYQVGLGTTGNQVGIGFLKVSRPLVSNDFEEQVSDFIPCLQNGGYSTRTLANAVTVAGFARVTAYVISNGTNTNFFSNFDYSEV